MTNPKLGQPVKNKHKVYSKAWRKWDNHAKRTYNKMYYELRHSMQWSINGHPQALPMPKEAWETLRHNVAFLAAAAVNGKKPAPKHRGKQVPLKAIIKATRDLTLKSVAKKAARKSKGKRRGR